jgi:hypothetical protein
MTKNRMKTISEYLWDSKNKTVDIDKINVFNQGLLNQISKNEEVKRAELEHIKNTEWYQKFKEAQIVKKKVVCLPTDDQWFSNHMKKLGEERDKLEKYNDRDPIVEENAKLFIRGRV